MIVAPATAPFPPDAQEPIAVYLDLVERVPAGGWTALASFADLADGAAVERDSRTWMQRLVRERFDPHRIAKAEMTAHHATDKTFDLLRWRFRAEGFELEITESVMFALVRVAPEGGFVMGADERANATAIAELAERVLVTRGEAVDAAGEAVPYAWDLVYEPPLGEGTRLSSAPDADPLSLPSWTTRLDGGIANGVPFFLGHKVHTSGDGRIIALSGRHWFDGKCWEPYAAVTRAAP